MRTTKLDEGGSGYVGSADIAGNPNPSFTQMRRRAVRNGDHDWYHAIKAEREQQADPEFQKKQELQARREASLKAAKEKLAKRKSMLGRFKSFIAGKERNRFRISESFDMSDVMSRLSGLEGVGAAGDSTVSFGVEDDDGNLMKVTVRSDQAERFEEVLAQELADVAQRREVTGEKTGISMAELLLKLNDEFEIVDASFPTIPSDGVYNADKVQYGVADTGTEEIGQDDGLDAFPEDPMSPDGDTEGGMEGGMDPMAPDGDMDPMAADGEMGDDTMGDDTMGDDASVEDFPEDMESPVNPEQNTLTAILDMLKAEAETRRAEADARAEEARAKQAEFTALATKNTVAQEEEFARMEAEISARKSKEKEAKRISDLARYRVSAASGLGENARPTFGQFLSIIHEFEEFDTVQTLTKQRTQIRLKYKPEPGDTPERARFKREAAANATRELDAKIRTAQAAARYKEAVARKERLQNKTTDPNNQTQQQQDQSTQQNNQNTGQNNAI